MSDKRRRGLGGRIERGARLANTGLRGLAGIAGARARELRDGEAGDPAVIHEEIAERLAEVLGEMKGAAMKLGQLLSFVDFDLPPEVRTAYHEALAKLRAEAPPFDPDAIAQVVQEDFGAPPHTIFADWQEEPIASASIGQVHAARLDDGTEVVVKVQYPGVAEAVRADLRNVEAFKPLVRLLNPNLEVAPLIEELRERVGDELDYEREAQYQRAFANRYDGHPFIHVPQIVGDLCRGRVLVSERVRGMSFDALARSDDEELKQAVGEAIYRYAFGSIARFRLFNGDPHPGNYLIEDTGDPSRPRVAFVDYGSVKMFTRERYAQMRAVDDAVVDNDQERFLTAMRDAGFIPPGVTVNGDRLFEWFRLFTRPVVAEQPFEFTPEFAAEVLRTTTDPRSEYAEVLRKLNLPPDYLLLNRIQWGINSVLGRLHATNHWRAIRDELVVGTPPVTELGKLDQQWWEERDPMIEPPA
ncbi:MAG: AarF/ABC1/UbiB kinase family protein [Nitriliruptorales bacterium]|nr:AarF/ABC1/UbiB kinase family protein [Nitriliruptorales bacterium]